jgi:glycosyltransferase involved in cell wall biosynthesis
MYVPRGNADAVRVLYDVSTLGLGYLYQQSRGGAYRADLHICEGLAAAPGCELLFCANHSAVAYRGCEGFLRGHSRLGHISLVAPRDPHPAHTFLRAAASTAHRGIRRVIGSNVLPSGVRQIGRAIDRRLHPPVMEGRVTVDVFHSSLLAPLPSRTSPAGTVRLLTVYDLSFFRFPAIYGPVHREALQSAIRSIGPGDHIITTSSFVRDELAADGIAAPERIHVVPLAAEATIFYPCEDRTRLAAVRRKYAIPDGPYVLGVNTPDARKNVADAVHAFARARREAPTAVAALVLVGHPLPQTDAVHQALAAYPELHDRIRVTGYVPDEDLAPLYSGAHAFVYSSVYEGFGLPPLEAMQCGTPVIASNTSSLPEVVGHGGVLVPPGDREAIAAAMLAMATDPDLRPRLRQRALLQAGRFTWERSTQATLQAYRAARAG